MPTLPPILFLTPDPPGAIWQDKPQIARRLARVTQVLYVGEEPYLRAWPGLAGVTQPALIHVVDGLYTFRWSTFTPVTGAPLLGPFTAALRRRRLQSALRRFPFPINHSPIPQFPINHSPRPILWLFRPGQQHWIDQIHPRLVIYHVVDEYSAYPGLSPAQVQRQRDLDRQLTTRADLVFCTAQSLVDARLPLNPHTHYMPNAVEFEAFQRAEGRGQRAAENGRARPILGVVGGINAKLDLALLAEVAMRRPDWIISLVGPLSYSLDANELARLRALPNVHFAGAVLPEQVPAVMAGCDVGLIPYKLNEQTRHVNPLKVYEYLAAGKPVVGTPLPELRQFEPLVRLAGNVEGFVAAVEAALAEGDGPQAVAARLAVAAANTWDVRVERMVELVEEALGRSENG
ncbi:MAG TPA: glycosyltransferase [Anaerolineae bacterium]|nr:glycosyltransferase [Anaerolineae bacterium]